MDDKQPEAPMARDRSAAWDDVELDAGAPEAVGRDERIVRRGFWAKLRRVVARLPFAEDLLTAYYCAFDRDTPLQVKAALMAALAYFVLPFDFMPDVMPLLGFTDDAAVLATAIRMVAAHLRPEHRTAARAAILRQKQA
ncbi:MAG TPA: YkvA family protein [Xanthobacteraceae bacterium]|jgi:uncharacterized membrane protein YkvA (DUF1232 family)